MWSFDVFLFQAEQAFEQKVILDAMAHMRRRSYGSSHLRFIKAIAGKMWCLLGKNSLLQPMKTMVIEVM